jgi:hypothetical protein
VSASNFLDMGEPEQAPESRPKRLKRAAPGHGLDSVLKRMRVTDRHYLETTLKSYASRQSAVSHAAKELGGRKFSASLLTAIGVNRAGDVRYLICIERTK